MNTAVFTLKSHTVFKGYEYTGDIDDFPDTLDRIQIKQTLEKVRISYVPDILQPGAITRGAIPGDWLFVGLGGRMWALSKEIVQFVYNRVD